MSRETTEWLNTQTLIGFTSRRGNAWHYRAASQGAEPNHYTGAIPPDDVRRRLFHWEGVKRRIAVEVRAELGDWTHTDDQGNPMRWSVLDDRFATDRSDRETGEVFGLVGDGYKIHQYGEWLVESVENLLGEGLQISSAGLLKQGAIAWVEVSVAENRSTAQGVVYRPNLLATTSMDGTSATTYKRTITDVVCDNTRAVALRESGADLKIRHSRHSDLQVATARDALQIIESAAEAFEQQVSALVDVPVPEEDWKKFLEAIVPFKPRDSRYVTELKEHKRETLDLLYRNDERCAPWNGTAHGVIQAVNTWEHHVRQPHAKRLLAVEDSWRAARNAQRTVDGNAELFDQKTYRVLQGVLGLAA